MKKKILLVTSEFPPLPGGIGNHAYLLSKYLHQNSFEVTVLCDVREVIQDAQFDRQQQFKIQRTPRNKFTYFKRIWSTYKLAQKNDRILCSGKFSLWTGAIIGLVVPHQKSTAVLHGSELKAGGVISRYMTKWSLSQFDHLIAVSEFTKQFALNVNPALKIEVINNGIELKNDNSPKLQTDHSNTLSLVTVGNLTFRKGQQNGIKALPLLKKYFPNVHYHCVGIPTEKEKFSILAKELGVLENITFHGILSDAERNTVIQESTIFVMLSQIIKNDFEGFGIALLEANALGIPAVGSRNSGIADAIKDGYSGKLVDQENPIEILEALQDITTNYDQYAQQAINWSHQFDWNQVIKKYIKILQS
ncbi:MAG: glycosyltransferase family 4 protein [Flavobacterium sp.]|nr:glycosyltransferase family 4 protein [Flavobacterium sp.]